MQCVAESSSQLEDNEEDQVDDIRPLATVSISGNTEYDGADGTEHEYKGDAPCYVCGGAFERFGEG